MKQIDVSKECNGCGLCVMNCSFLKENDEGNAEFIKGMSISENDIKNVEQVISDCPQKALSIVDVSSTSKSGAAGAKEVLDKLKKSVDDFKIAKIGNSAVKLDAKRYPLDIPYSSREYRREYSSESSARTAARDEFNRLCYSESAYRPMIKKVFVEYKVNVLKPYYTCEDNETSAYYQYNVQMRDMLSKAYAEIKDLLGGSLSVGEDWTSFSVYPAKKDWGIEALAEFDERSTSSGIISSLKDISHTSLNDYVSDMDFDSDEEYAGEGLFGKTKYKTVWYFDGFRNAAKSFIDDLTWAIGYMSSDIEEGAVDNINSIMESLEKSIKEEMNKKISLIEKSI